MLPESRSGRSRPSQRDRPSGSKTRSLDAAPPRSSGADDRCPGNTCDRVTVNEIVADGEAHEAHQHLPLSHDQAMVILQRQGRCHVMQGTRSITLEQPDVLLLDLGKLTSITRFAHSRQVVVHLPAATVQAWSLEGSPWSMQVIPGSSGIGAALGSLIVTMNAGPDALEDQQGEGVWAAVIHLAFAALGAGRECQTAPPRLLPAGTEKPPFLETIELWLADPGLNPARVAARHDVSLRHLHRLFRRAGTSFDTVVRTLRLERCREDLADPRLRAQPITEIAFRWGFSDSAHFSRCFRAAFGCTPRDVRAGRAIPDRASPV